jgi:cellulose synthase/poly-beta-1,6-N-acetylglucosamine synthase-like glycosyltransferase
MPAFIYFFKLLYPFNLSNLPGSRIAAASGGCILLETRALEAIGGFGTLKNALIDDCGLATRIKSQGHRTWIGLTHSARSLRAYTRLAQIWAMVERTAFTQLNYSIG